MKKIIAASTIFFATNAFCCSLHYSSPWFWKISELANKSEWIIVGTLQETIVDKDEKYLIIKADEILKNINNVTNFKIGPFSNTVVANEKVEKGIDCNLYVNLDVKKKYIIFSESYNRSSILPFTKKEKDKIAGELKDKKRNIK